MFYVIRCKLGWLVECQDYYFSPQRMSATTYTKDEAEATLRGMVPFGDFGPVEIVAI